MLNLHFYLDDTADEIVNSSRALQWTVYFVFIVFDT